MDSNLPLLVRTDVVFAELLKKLSHAKGVSPSDTTTIPEANAKDDAYALSQQMSDPPMLPLQQPETWVSLALHITTASDAFTLLPFAY